MSQRSAARSPTRRSASADLGIAAAIAGAFRPEPALLVSAWADRHRVVPKSAGTPEPGRWRTALMPYLRDILDALSVRSGIRRVVWMKAAQIGATESAATWIGYLMHQAPGPILVVEPTVELSKRFSRQRLEGMIAETDVLRPLVRSLRGKDAANTTLLKEFPGGVLVLTGANSAAGLRSMTARFLCFDEVDAYPGDVEGEGDPVALAEARSRNLPRRKVLIVSTPTIAGLSRIEREYQATDQRRYFVPCPFCGAMQELEFPRLRWEPGRPETVRYHCAACDRPITEANKPRMLARGAWRPTAVGIDPTVIGFHLNSLYSPLGWFAWADIARAAEEAARDPLKRKTFENITLGLPYAERGEAPDWHRLRERQTADPLGQVPAGVLFLTAGVDIQRDRIEASVWGWGREHRSWLVDHHVLEGDVSGAAPWAALTALVGRRWPMAGRELELPLARIAVDTGFATTQVHTWARSQAPGRILLVRGGPRSPALLSLPRSAEAVESAAKVRRRRKGLRVWQVDVHWIKAETYGWLALAAADPPPPGWISLPAVGDEFLRQLTAEQLVRKVVRGVERLEWQKLYNRNEALDARVYARAAAHHVGLDRMAEGDFRALEAALGVVSPPVGPPPPVDAGWYRDRTAPEPPAPRRRRSDFWGDRGRR